MTSCSRWASHFWVKMHFFKLLSTIKIKLVDEMMQSAYLCVILCVKHKKLPFIAVLTWFLILGKIQDGGQDGEHCWWRHCPPAVPPSIKYTSSCWEDQRFSTEGKIFSKYCNISKPLRRGPCTTAGGMNLRVRQRVNQDNLEVLLHCQWLFRFISVSMALRRG